MLDIYLKSYKLNENHFRMIKSLSFVFLFEKGYFLVQVFNLVYVDVNIVEENEIVILDEI